MWTLFSERHGTDPSRRSGSSAACENEGCDHKHVEHIRQQGAAPALSIYGSSKAVVEHLTRCWALELAPQGIRVNAIAPGPVETDFLRDRMRLSPDQIAAVTEQERKMIPLGRRGVLEDVAMWILNVGDPHSTWMTGQVIAVDGGLVTT